MKKIFLSAILFLSAFVFYAQENTIEVKAENLVIQTEENLSDEKLSENVENTANEVPKAGRDVSVLLYAMPSWFGIETQGASFMKFRKDSENVQTLFNISGEVRGNIVTVKNFTFAWAAGLEAYSELKTSDGNKFSTLNACAGAGVYLNSDPSFDFSLDGVYLFFYPLYYMPVVVANHTSNECIWGQYDKNGYAWKMAVEFGRTFNFLSYNFSPCLRCIPGWTKEGNFNMGFGFALSFGLNF